MTSNLIYFSQSSDLFEGPIFDKENELLYFVSILDGLVFCYNPKTKEILSVKLDSPTSNIYLVSNKIVLVASKNGFYEVDFKTLTLTFKFQIDIDPMVRYNDGIEDTAGRYIIGTMGYPMVKTGIGNVYSYHKNEFKIIIKNTTISNGLAFSSDNQTLYFIDTPTKKVAKYSYDIGTGDAEFIDYVIEFKNSGSPDGMCIDKNGMLWIAEWGGACVSQWNPLIGKKVNEITIPFTNVTSCCLDNESNLYVTTAKDESSSNYQNGSGLFHIKIN
ncbi:SMP-30/gluconolactonase/LRE family protein [Winogradskyella flava]|uniref:SMP-30/gluconolactonase/LRE family protein n=1 Tax=Winogradskyella flava TaxID=1884876 RepID=A0A842IVT5_9FLAO|nr:SMP-30/gluconolactonase/LRE family protein [Winogradskyella flava]MBC2845447.1 SMP-30/gluconolactonase/LRE family protein [Winogradskyella flava]